MINIRPDFFIVGAPKSATTALYDYLQQHPQVFMPPVKELHFFGTDLEFLPPARNFISGPRSSEDLKFYYSFFRDATGDQVIGEASVWYLYSERAAIEIKEFRKDAKIIIMLRNPVDYLHSLHSQFLWESNEDIEDFREALMAEGDRRVGTRIPSRVHFRQGLLYRDTAKFASQVRRYLETFGEDQVLILLLDDLVLNPSGFYRSVLEFLGVSLDFSADLHRVNANKKTRSKRLQDQLIRPNRLVRVASKILPRGIRSRSRSWLMHANTQEVRRPDLDASHRRDLSEVFRSEVSELQDLLGRDLSSWL